MKIESICRQQIKCYYNDDPVFDSIENIAGKGGNAGYPLCFQQASYSRLLKVWDCVIKGCYDLHLQKFCMISFNA